MKKKKYNLDKRFISFLRREWWFYCEARKEALNKAKCIELISGASMWQCAKCKKRFVKVYVDHIKPIGRPKDEKRRLDWNKLRDLIWFTSHQVLCKKCHNKKTKREKRGKHD